MIPPSGTVTTYSAYSAAIIATMQERFGTDFRYGHYELLDELMDPATEIQTPALLLELRTWSAAPAEGLDAFGRRRRRCSWNIHGMLSVQTPSLQVALRELSLEVDDMLYPVDAGGTKRRGATWGLTPAVDPVEDSSAQPGGFRPGLHGIDSWVIAFDQIAYLA